MHSGAGQRVVQHEQRLRSPQALLPGERQVVVRVREPRSTQPNAFVLRLETLHRRVREWRRRQARRRRRPSLRRALHIQQLQRVRAQLVRRATPQPGRVRHTQGLLRLLRRTQLNKQELQRRERASATSSSSISNYNNNNNSDTTNALEFYIHSNEPGGVLREAEEARPLVRARHQPGLLDQDQCLLREVDRERD